jgi:hypothetical protein
MREHGYEHGPESGFRPKGDRIERESDDVTYRAAGAGRTDVLDAARILGLQRAVGNAGVGSLFDEERSPVHEVVNSGRGSPLDAGTRTDMEARFGQDFGDVRVHTDGAAHDSARSVNAQAYTVGSDVVFQQGRYDPSSDEGRHMLAHELTHVVQQRSGPVDGTAAGGGVRISDPSDRFEREAVANAGHVMAAPTGGSHADAAVQRTGEASVQREEAAEDEEQSAQTFVQRAEEEEGEEAPS